MIGPNARAALEGRVFSIAILSLYSARRDRNNRRPCTSRTGARVVTVATVRADELASAIARAR